MLVLMGWELLQLTVYIIYWSLLVSVITVVFCQMWESNSVIVFFLYDPSQPPDRLGTQRAAGERKLSGRCTGRGKITFVQMYGFFSKNTVVHYYYTNKKGHIEACSTTKHHSFRKICLKMQRKILTTDKKISLQVQLTLGFACK